MFRTGRYRESYKAPSPPPGGAFSLWMLQRCVIREGDLFKKLDDKDINDSFISLLSHISRIQHTILRVKYTHLAQFKTISN